MHTVEADRRPWCCIVQLVPLCAEMAALAQMSGWSGAQSLHAQGGQAVVYSGMIDCFQRTVREEGVKALFKAGPKLASMHSNGTQGLPQAA